MNAVLTFVSALSVIFLYYRQPELLEGIEERMYDFRFRMRGELKPSGKTAIAAIDEKSIEELGRFPWPRGRFAELVDRLSASGAKAILFDIFFPEGSEPAEDEAFASALGRSGITALPVFFEISPEGSIGGVTENIPGLKNASRGPIHINMTPDPDGVVRRTPLAMGGYPSLSLRGAMDVLGLKSYSQSGRAITLGEIRIPLDEKGRMLINYTGPDGLYERFSISDVISGKVAAEKLKDKVILVGATAMGIYDLRVTPFSNNTPGVEVNANIIDNILRGDFIGRGWQETLMDLFFIVFLSFLVSFVILRARPLIALPFVMAVLTGYFFLVFRLFLMGMWVSTVYPALGVVLSYSITASLRFFFLEKSARQIRWMFSSYVSKNIVEELVKNPKLAKVGGQQKLITILFCDLKGYTRFSERYSPQEVVRTLNEYLSEMVDVIMKYDGTLDKFMGDGIMAFWGAPLTQENHAELGVRCALEMTERLQGLHRRWHTEEREPLEAGVGINTGEVIVGNIGVEGKKMEYTAVGDSVNITYRIQNLSREIKKPVMTESLYERVKDIVEAEHMGSMKIRGREAPLDLYVLTGLKRTGRPGA